MLTQMFLQFYILLYDERGECLVPDDVVDDLARFLLPHIQEYFCSDEGREMFEQWQIKRMKKGNLN